MKLKYSIILLSAITIWGCKPKLEAENPEKGVVDATRYVAVGGSMSAGFADGALYYEGQENSFSAILAAQFQLIGGGEFHQPWMPTNSVGVGFTGKSRTKLGYRTDCLGVTSLGPIALDPTGGDVASLQTNVYSTAKPFHNLSVPGSKSTTLLFAGYGNPANGSGNFNPFFTRMAANPITSSVVNDAVASNPTFFSIQVGEQDILEYALTGATSGTMTPANGSAGIGFDGTVEATILALKANGAKGVIGNVPDITKFPYFNTIPYNGLNLDATNATTLNNVYNQMGISFQVGSNGFIIEDASAQFGVRQIQQGELILLSVPLDSIKCNKLGSLFPIPDKYVLTADEIQEIQARIAAYNTIIATSAATHGLALADVNTLLKSVKTGIVFNGIGLNANFVSGGTFSLDGLHLNPIGNALVANVYIKAINQTFGSTIPQVDATKYRGVKFP